LHSRVVSSIDYRNLFSPGLRIYIDKSVSSAGREAEQQSVHVSPGQSLEALFVFILILEALD